MAEPNSGGNGTEVRTPGGYFLKIGGPLALIAALMGFLFWISYQDRQASLRLLEVQRAAAVKLLEEQFSEIIGELKLIRCAFMMPEEDRRKLTIYWEHEEQIRKHCRWLTFGDHREGGVKPSPRKP